MVDEDKQEENWNKKPLLLLFVYTTQLYDSGAVEGSGCAVVLYVYTYMRNVRSSRSVHSLLINFCEINVSVFVNVCELVRARVCVYMPPPRTSSHPPSPLPPFAVERV